MKFNKLMKSDSLKTIMYVYFGKVVGLFFCLWIIIFILVQKYYVGASFMSYFNYIIGYGFMFLTILVLAYFVIIDSIDTYILKEFEKMKNDMKQINSKNLSKRISLGRFKEFNSFAKFSNSILDKLEELIVIEKKLAVIDPLTLAFNRRALDEDFSGVLDKAQREKGRISMLMVDIDNFKKLNDTYGHDVGDKVLVNFSRILKKQIRKYDVLYRLGGEEFLIVFYNISKKFEKDMITRLNKKVTYDLKKMMLNVDGEITFSGGFVSTIKSDLKDKDLLNNLLKKSDELMYSAKTSGKNKIIIQNGHK